MKSVGVTTGGEGLTPGYWKQTQHFNTWVATGYNPSDSFNTIFGVNDPDNPTLLQALQTGGGGFDALGRHAVAALLNSAHPNIEYAYTTAQVIAKVQSAYANPSTVETIKDQLAVENEREADLSTSGGMTVSGPGQDADTAPGLVVEIGSQVEFTYFVTNPGEVPLSNVVVTDDNATPGDPTDDFHPVYVGGDTDNDGLLDVGETWQYTAGPQVVTSGQHTNIAIVTGTPVGGGGPATDSDAANWYGGFVPEPEGNASVSGFVYADLDNDGEFDSNEVGIVGVPVKLIGAGADGNFGTADDTTATTTTDRDGFYQFTGLAPGIYKILETQPTAYNDGKEALGTGATGTTGASILANDIFKVDLNADDDAINFNFGEITLTTGGLRKGDTATIGYWHNKNGQALIQGFGTTDDGRTLGGWLADTFPYLYGDYSDNNLRDKFNSEIADVFLDLFKVSGQKTEAQTLAVAFAIYATTDSLGGGAASDAQGFNVSILGTGSRTYNVGSYGSAIGLSDNGTYSILCLLKQADLQKKNGTFNANAFNAIFDGINTTGDR